MGCRAARDQGDGSETCDAINDCQPGTPVVVDDGVACTDDSCNETGDVVVNAVDDNFCDDGNPCTAEVCDSVTGCANVQVKGCAVVVPSSGSTGRSALVLCLAAAALLGLGASRGRARIG